MIGSIILAAGSSSRFGDDKRKAQLANGKMVIAQTLDNVLPHFDAVILTLRNDDIEFQKMLDANYADQTLTIFRAQDSALGMGHSLANTMSQVPGWDGVFVFLADMPNISGTTVELLAEALQADRIVIPLHDGQRGHPVGFGNHFFDKLSSLEGDLGAKAVLNNNAEEGREIDVTDPGVLQDIDQPADLQPSGS